MSPQNHKKSNYYIDTGDQRRSHNPSFMSACVSSKIWLNIWRVWHRPKSGTINSSWLCSKHYFAKMLRKPFTDFIDKNPHKIAENPLKLLKKFERPWEQICALNVLEPEWINYYKYEYFSPDPARESNSEKKIIACLKKHEASAFIIKPSDVSFYCWNLNKRNSLGVDRITFRYFDCVNPFLFNHLSLLFQMSIENRFVPHKFIVGQITLSQKRQKGFYSV